MRFQRWVWLTSVLFLWLLAVACGNEGRPAGTVSPGPAAAAKLAFAYNPTGEQTSLADGIDILNHEIYLVDADGSNLTRLTNDAGDDVGPAWSPDGRKASHRRVVRLVRQQAAGEVGDRSRPLLDAFETFLRDAPLSMPLD